MKALILAAGRASSLLVAEHGVEHTCLLDVGAHLHASQGDEADPWIVDLARQERGELGSNLVGDAIGTGALGHGK